MRQGPETLREVSFHQAFWREINEAYEHLQRFKQYGKEADINQSWVFLQGKTSESFSECLDGGE